MDNGCKLHAKLAVSSFESKKKINQSHGTRRLIQSFFIISDYPVEIQPITTSQSPNVHRKVNPPSSTHYSNNSMHPPSSSSSSSSTFHDHHVPKSFKPNSQQSHLDEITNKVFNELLQEKVDAHSQHNPSNMRPPVSDHGSTRSDDFGSETSSGIFGRLKRRDSNFPVSRLNNKAKKIVAPSSTTGSDDGVATDGVKKPLIAKWKAGVKLQVTGRTDNHGKFFFFLGDSLPHYNQPISLCKNSNEMLSSPTHFRLSGRPEASPTLSLRRSTRH